MIIQRLLSTWCVRLAIIGFWICCIGSLLVIPNYLSFGRSVPTLTILAMPNSISADTFDLFETEHGIKVHLTYAENADEMYMKLVMTGASGYDLVMIPDYQIPLLKQNKLIQPLDKKRLSFFDDLYPALLDHAFDPGNHYSIPYYWGVFGFAVDSTYFGDVESLGWGAIFDEKEVRYGIGMREDPREIILMAAFYLFGRVENLGEKEYVAIKNLLIKQKEWVTMYADERIGSLLASRASPLVVTLTGDIMRTMVQYPHIKFYIPREGGFVDIDSFVISAASKKIDEVYAFLNYLYTPEILGYYVHQFQFIAPLKTVPSDTQIPSIAAPTKELFERLLFFNTSVPSAVLSDIMVALKTA
jgi:spermidine/putrescine transport system substrate-binding protein